MTSTEEIREMLKKVLDPELGIDIVSLGFIYSIKVKDKKIDILMTLSSPGCPLASYILSNIEEQITKQLKDYKVNIEITFDPPWTPDKMAKWAREQLGYE